MATGTEVVTTAFKKAKILAAGQTLTAEELADGLEVLNDMMHAWSLDGIDIGWSDIALADTLPVPDEYLRAVKYGLAVEIAPEYGVDAPQQVAVIAGSSKNDIRKSLHEVPEAEHDPTLITHGQGYNVLTD